MGWLARLRYSRLLLVAVLLFTAGRTERTAHAENCVPPPPDLVSWWPGDGSAVDIQDGNTGQTFRGVGYGPGFVGQAFIFDGFDDALLVADATNLNFGLGDDFTLDAWINLQSPVADYDDEIVVKEQFSPSGFSNGFRFSILRNTRQLVLYVDTGVQTSVMSEPVIPLNDWTHVAAVRNGTVGSVYINGVIAGTAQISDSSLTNSWPLTIGAVYDTRFSPPVQINHVFGGLIDEVELFNRALSAGEIADLFNAGSAGKCKTFTVCHKPGTPAQKTLTIPAHALSGHLGHGDFSGNCQ